MASRSYGEDAYDTERRAARNADRMMNLANNFISQMNEMQREDVEFVPEPWQPSTLEDLAETDSLCADAEAQEEAPKEPAIVKGEDADSEDDGLGHIDIPVDIRSGHAAGASASRDPRRADETASSAQPRDPRLPDKEMDYYNAAARREVKAEQGTGKIEPNEEQVADSNIGVAELSSSHLPGESKPGHGPSERNLRRGGAWGGWHTARHFLSGNRSPNPRKHFLAAFPKASAPGGGHIPPGGYLELNDPEHRRAVCDFYRYLTAPTIPSDTRLPKKRKIEPQGV